MKNAKICIVVRVYDKTGNYSEERYDNVFCENTPEYIMEDLVSGEVVCVELLPNVKAFCFEKPEDWPEDWAKQRRDNEEK